MTLPDFNKNVKKVTKTEEISDEKITDRAISCFKNFVQVASLEANEPERGTEDVARPDASSFVELLSVHNAPSKKVYFNFLNKIYDESVEHINEYQSYFFEIVREQSKAKNVFDVRSITAGISQFI